jgi:Zn-dependent peptidase ImmA (M78 family)/transcriptional regulator with XRE-family HTH domain
MRVGTPSFVASRLTEAREARGINTLLSLANLIGLNTSSVSRWEDGKGTPSSETLIELARILHVRPSYFLRPQFDHGASPVFFRSLAAARKRDIARQRARLRWFQEISIVIQHYADLPKVNIPDVLNGVSFRQLRPSDLERIASELRAYWELGSQPIPNVLSVLERVGFVIAADEMGTSTLDGLCNWSAYDKRPYLVLAKDKMSFFRRQMDAAHEMAHAVIHKTLTPDDLKADFELIEQQAFRLASAFLMPAETFALEVTSSPTLSQLLMLKDRWRVSVKAMIRRCSDLGIVGKEEATQLYKYYSGKGWSREEPMDRTAEPAKPRMMAQALSMIVEAGRRTKDELLTNEFTVPARDVEELLGLDEGWFASRTGEVVQLKQGPNRNPETFVGGSEIIPFEAHRRVKKPI